MYRCWGDNLPSWEIFQKLSTYSSPEAAEGILALSMQICKARLEVASSSSLLNPWKKAWLSGCLQGEDSSACDFLSQSINSHCGGRREIGTFYMHFDVPQ